MQEAKGEEDARPWGTDVLQAYMDKQLGKECATALRSCPVCVLCGHEKQPLLGVFLHAVYHGRRLRRHAYGAVACCLAALPHVWM